MITPNDYQGLKNLGVNKDIAVQESKYRNCAGCGASYSPTLIPILLACGHFICQECKNYPSWNNKCQMQKCSKLMEIKENKFTALLEMDGLMPKKNTSDGTYSFRVKGSAGINANPNQNNIPEDVNFEDFVKKSTYLNGFISEFSSDKLCIIINGSSHLYDSIKKCKLSEPRLKLMKNRVNQVLVYQLNRGGQN